MKVQTKGLKSYQNLLIKIFPGKGWDQVAMRNVISTIMGGWVFQLDVSSAAVSHFLKSQTNPQFFMLLSVKPDMNKILSLLFRNIAAMCLFSVFHISRYKMVKPLLKQRKSKVCNAATRLSITKYLNDYACFLCLISF